MQVEGGRWSPYVIEVDGNMERRKAAPPRLGGEEDVVE